MAEALIIIPTYNEKDNIESLIVEIFKYAENANILVVDDNSSDGTAGILDRLAAGDNRISVIHRLSNRGRGSAGVDAFKEALKRENVKYIIEMDGDFSHHPRYIRLFLEAVKNADIVIGSRYIYGGMDSERSYIRIIMSKLVNLFIRKYLGFGIMDCTSGYRCFKKQILASMDLNSMISKEPSIIEEILYECKLRRYSMKEVPIVFQERRSGRTKLGIIKLIKVFMEIVRFKNEKAFNRTC